MATVTPGKHRTRTPGHGAAWAVLIGTAVTSVTYNVVHALPVLELALALLLGFAPAFVAACLSHVAAVLDAPGWVKAAVIAVMLGGMVLSASNTAAVVAPAEPGWRGWLFGIVLDAGALLALWAIMASRRQRNEATAAVEAARTETQAARAEAHAATAEAAELRAGLGTAQASLAEVQAELAALRERNKTRNRGRNSGRNQGRNTGRNTAPSSARNTAPSSAPSSAPATAGSGEDELSIEARALQEIAGARAKGETLNGSELGRRLGVTERYGRDLIKKLAAADAPADIAGAAG